MDNSPADEAILKHIRGLAQLTGGRLTLVHVADGFMARNQEQLGTRRIRRDARGSRLSCRPARRNWPARALQVDTILACGEPAEHIVAIAERDGCDLIAMSTHGHRLLGDLILGSVASEVRHRTDIPVLMVRARAKADRPTELATGRRQRSRDGHFRLDGADRVGPASPLPVAD